MNPMKLHQEVTAAAALDWRRTAAPIIRVRIPLDVVPGGLSLAMAPMFVNWQASSLGSGPDAHYIIQNVNVANNPAGGILVLAALKVFRDSVESVQYVNVVSKVAGRETPAGHGMLRFIFRQERRPIILDRDGQPFANDAFVEDLVVSWEAWRPPEASFDPLSGLDPKTYALTPRCLLGSVRCLTDAILDRPWQCYPLQLPEVEQAHDELFYASIALADAVARQTVANLIGQRIERGKSMPEGYSDPELSDWEELDDYYKTAQVPERPLREVLDGKIRYQLLQRSCITMALLSVDWANHRIHQRAGLGAPKHIRVGPRKMPEFISELVSGERTPLLLRVPAALHWIVKNQTVIPAKAHELLDEVGLLERTSGRPKRLHFDNRRSTPYGSIAHHIIY